MSTARTLRIPRVEDNRTVSEVVRDASEACGWIETCADRTEAMWRRASGAQFDLLIFDNELSGLNGARAHQASAANLSPAAGVDHHALGQRCREESAAAHMHS